MGVAIITGLVIGLIGLAIAYLVYFITADICKGIDQETISNRRFHKIRVEKYFIFPTCVYLDGYKLKGVRSVDYQISDDELPILHIELIGGSIDIEGENKIVPCRK